MNKETILTEPSFLTCEINGSQFIFQTLENSRDEQIKMSNNIDNKSNNINISRQNDKINNDTIPLVCIEGQIYMLQDGQLQKLDITQLENTNNQDVNEKTINTELSLFSEEENLITNSLEDDEIVDSINESIKVKTNCYVDTDSLELQVTSDNLPTDQEKFDAMDFVEVVTTFKCKICPFTTQDRPELLKHFENTHANPLITVENNDTTEDVKLLYVCGECSNCFPSIENCREHMINDHQLMDKESEQKNNSVNNNQQKSIQLNEKSPTKQNNKTIKLSNTSSKSLDQVNTIKVKEKNIKCSIKGCIYKFSSDESMQKHVIYHVKSLQNTFKCTICPDTKFTKWKACSLHLWKKHEIDIDMIPCPICNIYKSATTVKLLTHMRVHSESRDFKCNDCGKCFKQSSQLRNHRVMHLDRKSMDLPRWYTSKTCQMCGKTYADSKCLKNHMQSVHLKLKPYVCNICGHSSARKAMLQMHKRQHTGDKPFNCDLCEYKTGDHNSLRRHVMRHTGYRGYRCPHCPYSAIQSSSYKNHLRSKHPDSADIFICNQCSFKTVRKESYLKHISDHKKGLIKTTIDNNKKNNDDDIDNDDDDDDNNVEVFPANIAAAQLVYRYFGASSKVGKTSLMSSSTSADGTSQTITIQIPSKDVEGSTSSLLNTNINNNNNNIIEQEDDEMDCFLKITNDEEENIDTGGITIPADPDDADMLNVVS